MPSISNRPSIKATIQRAIDMHYTEKEIAAYLHGAADSAYRHKQTIERLAKIAETKGEAEMKKIMKRGWFS